jgi:hypothetical protein
MRDERAGMAIRQVPPALVESQLTGAGEERRDTLVAAVCGWAREPTEDAAQAADCKSPPAQ